MATENNNKNLNVPNKREHSQTCLGYAERKEQSPQGNVPNLRFPEFSKPYSQTTISKLATIVGGGTPDTTIQEYWNGGIQWFTPSEIGKNKYADKSERTISQEGLNNSSAKLLPINTILLSTRATIGESSIAKEECCTNQGFQSLIANEEIVCYEYLYYLVATLTKELIRKSCGSTFLEISANEIRKIKTFIPNLEEQSKVSSLLSLIDDRIATQIKIIEDLKKLKNAISNLHFDTAIVNYSLVSIGDCIEQLSQRNKNGKIKEVLSVSNKNGFVNQSEQFEDREIASEDTSNYKIVRPNDFAYNPARINVGSIARLHNYSCGIVSPMYVCFHTMSMLLPEYFEHFFSTSYFKHEMYKRLEGSVRLCLTYDSLCNIKIALPSINEQQQFVSQISAISSKIINEDKLLVLYQTLKQYLLSQMFI